MAVTLTNEMITGAIKAQEQYGIPASVTLGQIMLESGGSYPGGLSGLAYNDNNLFGIKKGSGWTGKTATYKTAEYNSDGSKYYINAEFRKYDDVEQSILDHSKLLASPLYANKTTNTTTLSEYVHAIGTTYATSPSYANELLSIINKNNLTRYDNGKYAVSPSTGADYSNTGTTVTPIGWGSSILSWLVKFCSILLLAFLAVVFFMSAFKSDKITAYMGGAENGD